MAASIVLASASPRRRELLAAAGVAFEVVPSTVSEDMPPGMDVREAVQEVARRKAGEVAGRVDAEYVIGADTIVLLDGEVLGKPADTAEAESMVRRLQGREHRVLTGLAVVHRPSGRTESAAEETTVRFAPLTDEQVRAYLATFDPLDKAGGYAIQGPGALVIDAVEGCYYNVVGFPLRALDRLFAAFDRSLLSDAALRRLTARS